MRTLLRLALVPAFLAWLPSAHAAPVQSPDELCASDADPCVIDRPVEVSADHPLDFGTRTVRVSGAGHLAGTLELSAGAFEADVAGNWMDVALVAPYQAVKVFARRGCSKDPALPCWSNAQCRDAGKGLCSAGDGGIRLRGGFAGVAPIVELRAVSDIDIHGRMRTAGNAEVPDANTLSISSFAGSVHVRAPIVGDAGIDPATDAPGRAGYVWITAERDIVVKRRIRCAGRWGAVTLDADGDVTVTAPLLMQGGHHGPVAGGSISMIAKGDIRVEDRPGRRGVRLNVSGGSRRVGDVIAGASAGQAEFRAKGDLLVGAKAFLRGDGWPSAGEGNEGPGASDWTFEADGRIDFLGHLRARSFAGGGTGGQVQLFAGRIAFPPGSAVSVESDHGGTIELDAGGGTVSVDGILDARGSAGESGSGGAVLLARVREGSIGGAILNGGGAAGGTVSVEACRLQLTAGGRIDGSHFDQAAQPGTNSFEIRDSMTAEAGSAILGVAGATNAIVYRDAATPPLLLGTVEPAPVLAVDPSLPVCPQ